MEWYCGQIGVVFANLGSVSVLMWLEILSGRLRVFKNDLAGFCWYCAVWELSG